jgi:hypothetical protein
MKLIGPCRIHFQDLVVEKKELNNQVMPFCIHPPQQKAVLASGKPVKWSMVVE